MPLPVRFLLGSPRRLFWAVVLFITLDLSVLLINLWIANWVAMDAVAINLAGRQRMLSQRITKAALLASSDSAARSEHLQELSLAYRMFDHTLTAFAQGGTATGGDGQAVLLNQIRAAEGRQALEEALNLLTPLQADLMQLERAQTLPEDQLRVVRNYMVAHNLEILALMNRLTTALEQESVRRISVLRYVQTGAFVLALLNFLVIVLGLVRRNRQAEQEGAHWRHAAQRDALTGLYNRLAFDRRLELALAKARATSGSVTLVLIDLDDFKPVNDQHGHAVGDAVLRALAHTLQGVARESDTVARLGGDEFAVFCPNLHAGPALDDFCQRLLARLEQLSTPQLPSRVRASLGVAVFPHDGMDAPSLLHAADTAMYRSKQGGGQCYTLAADMPVAPPPSDRLPAGAGGCSGG